MVATWRFRIGQSAEAASQPILLQRQPAIRYKHRILEREEPGPLLEEGPSGATSKASPPPMRTLGDIPAISLPGPGRFGSAPENGGFFILPGLALEEVSRSVLIRL